MNRRFLAVLAATSIAVALLAAVSVAFRVFEADATGRKAASADFETLRYSFSRARNASDLSDPALRKRLAVQYRVSPNLLLIVVYERGAGVRWGSPPTLPIFQPPKMCFPGRSRNTRLFLASALPPLCPAIPPAFSPSTPSIEPWTSEGIPRVQRCSSRDRGLYRPGNGRYRFGGGPFFHTRQGKRRTGPRSVAPLAAAAADDARWG